MSKLINWKNAKYELESFGYQEDLDYHVQNINDKMAIIVKCEPYELGTFQNVLEANDLIVDIPATKFIIFINYKQYVNGA